jgi:hypothetical protein
MVAGTADHKAIAANFAHKIETTEDLPVGEVVESYVQHLEEEVEYLGGPDSFDSDNAVKEYDDARKNGSKLVRAYREIACPSITPISVEEEFSLDVPGIPVPLIGYIDLRTTTTMVDRKTAKRAPRGIQPEWRFQANVYQLRHKMPFEWHVSVHGATPQVLINDDLRIPYAAPEHTIRFASQVVGNLGFLYQRYGPDEPWPTNGTMHQWACGYCGYKANCAAWAGAR